MSEPLENQQKYRGVRASDRKLIETLTNTIETQLGDIIDRCVDSAHQLLTEDSDKPENISIQSDFLAAMKDLRDKKSLFNDRYLTTMRAKLLDIQAHSLESEKPQLSEDFELSLVQDSELQITMATNSIVNKVETVFETSIASLDARFACVFGYSHREDNEEENASPLSDANPVTPERLKDYFVYAIEPIETDITIILKLYKIYEHGLLQMAGKLYDALNADFLRSGVLEDFVPTSVAKEDIPFFKNREENLARTTGVEEQVASQLSDASAAAMANPELIANIGAAMQSAVEIALSAEKAGSSPIQHFFNGSLSPGSFPALNIPTGEIQSINEIANLLHLVPSAGAGEQVQGRGLQSIGTAVESIGSSETPTVGYDVLLHLLNKMQQDAAVGESANLNDSAVHPTPTQVLENIAKEISVKGGEEDSTIGHSERDTIGLVAMLFQFVIEDRVSSQVMQRALGRLQLPIIKVALKDPRFFSKGDHPARKFLNKITSSCISWVEQDDYHSDPFYKRISEFIDSLIQDFDDDLAVFERISSELEEFLEEDKARVTRAEKRLLDMEQGRDKAECAKRNIEKIILSKVSEKTPGFLSELLRKHWSNYLLRLALKEGEESDSYLQAVKTIDEINWSISPSRSKTDTEALLTRIPVILKNLRSGFETLGTETARAGRFFKALAAEHKEAMNRDPSTTPEVDLGSFVDESLDAGFDPANLLESEDDILPPSKPSTVELAASTNEASSGSGVIQLGEELDAAEKYHEENQAEQDPLLEKAENLAVGQWVELVEEADRTRCRLAAILRASGKRIFVNRRGVKALDLYVSEIVEMLRSEALVLLDDGQLFDKALSSIIGDLREQKRETMAC